MKSKIESRYTIHDKSRLCQGDILENFKYYQIISEKDALDWDMPYILVMSQDCDLESDDRNRNDLKLPECDPDNDENEEKTHDKFLQSILVCPAYPAEDLRAGTHLKDLDLTMEKYNSERWYPIKKNLNPRYHFLNGNQNMRIPNLVIDFKHYYTIPRDILYYEIEKKYLGTVNELFREFVSQRFAFYLSRIGLPLVD